MTTSAAMQSILASPLTLVANGSTRVNQFLPSTYAPRLPRNSSVRLRPMAKYIQDQEQATPEATKAKAKAKGAGTKFLDLFAFGGPAPERINGRLAMVGFVAAMGVELSRGQDLFGQISNGGVSWFLGTALVLSIASLIPLFKGVSVESKSESFWSSDAEMWNGRFAMLGLVALAFTEYAKGGGTLV